MLNLILNSLPRYQMFAGAVLVLGVVVMITSTVVTILDAVDTGDDLDLSDQCNSTGS